MRMCLALKALQKTRSSGMRGKLQSLCKTVEKQADTCHASLQQSCQSLRYRMRHCTTAFGMDCVSLVCMVGRPLTAECADKRNRPTTNIVLWMRVSCKSAGLWEASTCSCLVRPEFGSGKFHGKKFSGLRPSSRSVGVQASESFLNLRRSLFKDDKRDCRLMSPCCSLCLSLFFMYLFFTNFFRSLVVSVFRFFCL